MNKLRTILPWLMVQITRQPRYLPDIEWSKESWVHNIFRVYELIFWRKYGIRAESSVYASSNGTTSYKFYTFEAGLAYLEALIRNFFKVKWFEFKIINLQFAFPVNTPQLQIPWVSFAIAFDAVSTLGSAGGGTTDVSCTQVCTGSNLLLWAMPIAGPAASGSIDFTGVVYNSISMAQVGSSVWVVGCGRESMWYLAAPSTGSHTATGTANSSADNKDILCISYSGCKQTGIPDNSNSGTQLGGTTFDIAVTTVADNCWVMVAGQPNTGTGGSGTGTTARFGSAGGNFAWGVGDTNGVVHPAGSTTLQTTTSAGAANWTAIIVSFAPPVATKILSVSGVAQANILAVSGEAIANIQQVGGVPNV